MIQLKTGTNNKSAEFSFEYVSNVPGTSSVMIVALLIEDRIIDFSFLCHVSKLDAGCKCGGSLIM